MADSKRTMIKIDWKEWARNYTWFGWYVAGRWVQRDGNVTKVEWSYSLYWADRLCPVRHNHKVHPEWFLKIIPKIIK